MVRSSQTFPGFPAGDFLSHRVWRVRGADPPVCGPLAVIAAQLGHADTRMVEKHYGHLSPSYITDTVRNAFGSLGIVEPSNVTPMHMAG